MTKRKRQGTLHSVLGPIEVVYVDVIRDDAGAVVEDALGYFSGGRRLIQILNGQHPAQEAHTLRHEWIHVALWDSGATNLLSDVTTEVLCDVLATALITVPLPC